MKANSRVPTALAMASCGTQMVASMKECGTTTAKTVKVKQLLPTVVLSKVNGATT